MMSVESAIAYLVAVLIFAITPGPGVLAVMARSLVYGWRQCLFLITGIITSDLLYLLFACYGLAYIAENYHGVFIVIRLAGAAYLLYMGWQLWTNSNDIPETVDGTLTSQSWHTLIQGFLISASNPKVMIFYLAFVPGFMDLTQVTLAGMVLLLSLTAIGIGAGTLLVAWLADGFRQSLNSPRRVSLLNKMAGGMLMAVGVYIAKDR